MAKKKSSEMVAFKNSLVHRSARFTPLMTRCYVKVLWEFSKRYEVWEDLQPKNLFGDPDYSILNHYLIPLSEFDDREGEGGGHLKEVKTALTKLAKEGITIGDMNDEDENNDYAYFPFISGLEYKSSIKSFNINISSLMLPLLIEQKKEFTQFNAIIAMQFSGKYTERFYELCNQYRRRKEKTFFLEVDEIKRMFRLEDKYPRFNQFLERVIDPAKDEMKAAYEGGSCDLCFDYFTKDDEKAASGASGRGRKAITRIWFTITEKTPQNAKIKPVSEENLLDTQSKVGLILSVLGSVFGISNPYYRKIGAHVTAAIMKDVKVADRLIGTLKRIRKDEADGKVNDVAAYTRTVLSKEFGMTV